MKSIIHIFKTYKPLIILIFVLFLIIKIGFQIKYLTYQENFYSAAPETHLLVINSLSKSTNALVPNLTNLIVKNGNTVKSDTANYLENGFLNIYNKFGKDKFDKDTYTTDLPQLIIHSYDECPTLFNLFRAYPKLGAENHILALTNKVTRLEGDKTKKEGQVAVKKTELNEIKTKLIPYYILYDIFRLRLEKMELEIKLDAAEASAADATLVADAKSDEEDKKTKISEKKAILLDKSQHAGYEMENVIPLQTLKNYFIYQIKYNVYYLDNLKTSLNKIPVLKTQLEKIKTIIDTFPGNFKNLCYNIFLGDSSVSIFMQITNKITVLNTESKVKFIHTNTNGQQTNIDEFNFSIGNLDKKYELPPGSITTQVDSTYIDEITDFKDILFKYQDINSKNPFYLFTDAEFINYKIIRNLFVFIYNNFEDRQKFTITDNECDFNTELDSEEITASTNLESLINYVISSNDPFTDSSPYNINSTTEITFTLKKHIMLTGSFNVGRKSDTEIKYPDNSFSIDFKDFTIPDSGDESTFRFAFCEFIWEQKKKKIENDIKEKREGISEDDYKIFKNKIKTEYTEDDKKNFVPIQELEALSEKYTTDFGGISNIYQQKKDAGDPNPNIEYSLEYMNFNIEFVKLNKTYCFYKMLYYLCKKILRNKVDIDLNGLEQNNLNRKYYSFSFVNNVANQSEEINPIKMELYNSQNISQITGTVVNLDYETVKTNITNVPSKTVNQDNIKLYFDSLGFKNEATLTTNHNYFKTLIGGAITYLANTNTESLDTKTFSEATLTAYKTRQAHVANPGQKFVIGTSPTVAQDLKDYIDIIIERDKINYLNAEADLINFIEFMKLLKEKDDIEQELKQRESNLQTITEEYITQDDLLDIIEKQYRQNENQTGIQHRMKIQKEFFNLSQEVRVDYPLLDILVYDNPITTNKIVPQIYFRNNKIEFGNEIASTPKQEYIVKLTGTQKLYDEKQTHFDVKGDFSFPDILKFMDYSFTCLCWGAINIRLMKHTNNHYYAFPCQNDKCQNLKNKYFYLLPTKIAQLCQEEGKEYTRAKCNRCASNVIVYFDKIPQKFLNLFNVSSIPTTATVTDLL